MNHEFLTIEEEIEILQYIDNTNDDKTHPWKLSNFNGPHLQKEYGTHTDLKYNTIVPGKHQFPDILITIIDRIRQVVLIPASGFPAELRTLTNWRPNEANAIQVCIYDVTCIYNFFIIQVIPFNLYNFDLII